MNFLLSLFIKTFAMNFETDGSKERFIALADATRIKDRNCIHNDSDFWVYGSIFRDNIRDDCIMNMCLYNLTVEYAASRSIENAFNSVVEQTQRMAFAGNRAAGIVMRSLLGKVHIVQDTSINIDVEMEDASKF